ncbi:MAG: hypothetical protein HUN04_23890 [Desulfobacter sp.]|nr:MAG: hypothetical protein HUN04_23890 [Desulfobacter sp.]
MTKRISIGCIGPSDSLDLIKEVAARYFPGITLTPYVEEEISMAFRPLDKCQNENQGILFSGIGVQVSAMARGGVHLPYEHVPRGGYSLLRTLWEMLSHDGSVSRISIDVVEDDIIRDTIREMGIQLDKIHSMPFALALEEKAYLDRHRELYQTGKADALISGFGAVYDGLKQEGLPAFRLYPSRIQIRERLDRLLDRITARDLKSAGIAVQIIRLSGVKRGTGYEYGTMKTQGRFYLELLDYARSLQGSLFHMGNEFVIYSTRGAIRTRVHTEHFQTLLKWGEKRRIIIASGIGLGTTAFEAEKSARKGLAEAVAKKQNCVFMVNREQIQGPLGTEKELAYSMQASTPKDIDTAGEIGIAPGYLAKIKALVAKTGRDTFDAHDLAACLDISPRSARRILKKFTDAGFGRIKAKETAGSAGRPKNLIQLKI